MNELNPTEQNSNYWIYCLIILFVYIAFVFNVKQSQKHDENTKPSVNNIDKVFKFLKTATNAYDKYCLEKPQEDNREETEGLEQ